MRGRLPGVLNSNIPFHFLQLAETIVSPPGNAPAENPHTNSPRSPAAAMAMKCGSGRSLQVVETPCGVGGVFAEIQSATHCPLRAYPLFWEKKNIPIRPGLRQMGMQVFFSGGEGQDQEIPPVDAACRPCPGRAEAIRSASNRRRS